MGFIVVLGALIFLMFVAYRGYSVILFAPIAALGAVLLTDPSLVPPMFTGLFMDKMVGFVKLYFPVFMLGAIFGKVIELSGFSKSIVSSVIKLVGRERAMLSIVVVCAVLTYGGVSLFVVVFAVYPFAAEMFRQGGIPKRLIPGTIALGAFTFTMDSLPGTPQIQNIIPTTFFKTNIYAAPGLGITGAVFILIAGLSYLEWRRRQAAAAGEGYGNILVNEPEPFEHEKLANPIIAILPLFVFAGKTVIGKFAEGSKSAIAGALLASMNTASEYGFGAVIAALPGFLVVGDALKAIPNPLINEAITVTSLAGITGSASGGMSIALAAMAESSNATAAGIPLEVFHRVAAMASGGMDTLPHNGAVITLLAVTGLTHRVSYKDIFAITVIKTTAVFVVIGTF